MCNVLNCRMRGTSQHARLTPMQQIESNRDVLQPWPPRQFETVTVAIKGRKDNALGEGHVFIIAAIQHKKQQHTKNNLHKDCAAIAPAMLCRLERESRDTL